MGIFMFPQFACMVPLSSAGVSEVTIICPAGLCLCELLSVDFLFKVLLPQTMVIEQSYPSMFRTILVGTLLVLRSGCSCSIILGIVNPAQGL